MLLSEIVLGILVVFVVAAKGQDYGSSGNGLDCYPPCQEGYCMGGDVAACACRKGWKGVACDVPDTESPLRFIDKAHKLLYTYINVKVNFSRAMDECQRQHGRIAFNLSKSELFTRVIKYRIGEGEEAQFTGYIRSRVFWAISEEHPSQLVRGVRGENCSAFNLTEGFRYSSCDDKKEVLCVSPQSGSCYLEVTKQHCANSTNSSCEMNIGQSGNPTYSCRCRSGFRYASTGKCEDDDECRNRAAVLCVAPASCQNEYGTYRCICQPGQQGNGFNVCGYVITLEQQNVDLSRVPYAPAFGLVDPDSIFSSIAPTSTTDGSVNFGYDDQQAKYEIQQKLKSVYLVSTKSITRLVVKTINKTTFLNATAVYDVYVNDTKITPTSLVEFYREAERQNKLYWLAGSTPVPGFLQCTDSTLRLGNKFYTFGTTRPGKTVRSTEKCEDGRAKATAECKSKQNSDGTFTAFYDYLTVKAIPCEVLIDQIAKQALQVQSPAEVGTVMADLDSLTADYTKLDKNQFQEATNAMKSVADYVWNEKVDISADAMESMINVASNIDKGQKLDRQMGAQRQLIDAERKDIVQALERCSTHVTVQPSENVKIETESISLQVTNAMKNSTDSRTVESVSFRIGAASHSPCSVTNVPGVQAKINQDILATAKDEKSQNNADVARLPVSFMYFTDSEFFPEDSDGNAVEQVLSVRISDLNLTNLQNPLWFELPSKLDANKNELRYFKCAYLEEKTGRWVSDGCEMIPNSHPPRCSCDHMTNFAVLVQTHSFVKEYTLEVFGKLFCCISIIGLAMLLFIYLYFPSLRHSQIVKVHCHLALCLLITYMIFLTSAERNKPYGPCVASAAFLHFFLLSSWGWMLVECFTMYRKLVAVFSSEISRFVTKAATVVYTLSAIIALSTCIISVVRYDFQNNDGWHNPDIDFIPSVYISDRLCWLHSYSLVFGFLIPIGIAFVINVVVSILILRAITWGRKKVSSSTKNKTDFRAYFVRTITISLLLGICWVFAIPLTFSDDPTVNTVFGWLFSITNALQGFFLFVLLCVRREDVRKLWWKEIRSFFKGSPDGADSKVFSSESGKDTRMSSSAVGHVTVNTDATGLSYSGAAVVEEADVEPRENMQLGEISSFHPK